MLYISMCAGIPGYGTPNFEKTQLLSTLVLSFGVTEENLGYNLSSTLNVRPSHVECEKIKKIKFYNSYGLTNERDTHFSVFCPLPQN